MISNRIRQKSKTFGIAISFVLLMFYSSTAVEDLPRNNKGKVFVSLTKEKHRGTHFEEHILSNSPVLTTRLPIFPCGDALDKKIFMLALPATLNFAVPNIVGAVDTFYVGQMSNTLALAGQSAANQVFSSLSWIISFLPSVVAPLIARAAGAGDKEALQKHVGEAVFIGFFLGVIGTSLLVIFPRKMLSIVLDEDSPVLKYATTYLSIRGLTFLPSLLSIISIAVFRGTLDVLTPLKIALMSNTVNLIITPILIFRFGMGVSGAAAATCVTELLSFILLTKKLFKNTLVKLSKIARPPPWESLKPLLIGGSGVLLRALSMNIAFLAVTRTTLGLDPTGVAAAAHAISVQLWQLGGIFMLAMSAVATVIVPNEIAKSKKELDTLGLTRAKNAADRLMVWGLIFGFVLAGLQIGCLPLLNIFSPLESVQKAARLPSIVGALLQLFNGIVFIGEGIQQGNQYFISLAVCTAVAALGMLTALRIIGNTLAGVWASFAVFNFIRLFGVIMHHFFLGPLTTAKVKLSIDNCAASNVK